MKLLRTMGHHGPLCWRHAGLNWFLHWKPFHSPSVAWTHILQGALVAAFPNLLDPGVFSFPPTECPLQQVFHWTWRWNLGPGPDGHQQPCDLNKPLPLCGLQPSQPPNKDVGPLNDVFHICHSVLGMAHISHVSSEMEKGRKFKGSEERAQCDHSWVKQSVCLLLSYFLYLEPSMLVNPPFHSLHPCHGFTCC